MKNSQDSALFICIDSNDDNKSNIDKHKAIDSKTTWIAYKKTPQAHDDTINMYQKNRQDVRKLLEELLNHLHLDDSLCDERFPYRLQHHGYFVCFSHSSESCAVILSKTHSVGIDVENQPVPEKIALRHFHKHELAYLLPLTENIKTQLIRQLWQLKECLIKINKQTLFVGMKTDFSFLLPSLQDNLATSQYSMSLTELLAKSVKLSEVSPLTRVWIDNDRHITAVY